ncbi:caspase-1-like [Ceratina calcarata]|uniref:Caspase-1-like n=1 Tax=Ceratina calcarata TaxID=156304 RepID=A0AAJ7S0W9_9HYME|nr:caspase-1-like [Ceratina calcarata]
MLKESPVYLMKEKKRGKCVIFNHETFCNIKTRKGTEYDVDKIKQVFGKTLGFEMVVHNDLKRSTVSKKIERLCTEDYTDANCICIFILSHGSTAERIEAKDTSYCFSEIWEPFLKCRTLVGKPKLFFVQACRGNKEDDGTLVKYEVDSAAAIFYAIPTRADFLFAYGTTDKHSAHRMPDKGTWYIQSLCEVINSHWKEYDLLKILTTTSRTVALNYNTDKQKKQMPTFSSTLTRDFYFVRNNRRSKK